jgi:hypothetical protein
MNFSASSARKLQLLTFVYGTWLCTASVHAQAAAGPSAVVLSADGESTQPGAPPPLRIGLEVLSGAAGEALFGFGGILVGAMMTPANREESEQAAWTRFLVGGSIGGSVGAALGVASVGDALGGRGSWGFTFAGAAAGGTAGTLTWLAVETNRHTIAVEALTWLGLPLVGAVLGYELSATARVPPARASAGSGPRLRSALLQPTADGAGAALSLGGTF